MGAVGDSLKEDSVGRLQLEGGGSSRRQSGEFSDDVRPDGIRALSSTHIRFRLGPVGGVSGRRTVILKLLY